MKNMLTKTQEPTIIDLSLLPEPVLPHWLKTKVFDDYQTPTHITLPNTLDAVVCFGSKTSGKDILASLVSSYDRTQAHCKGVKYRVAETDKITSHHGLKALTWLQLNWKQIPVEQKHRIKASKITLLFGFADVYEDDQGNLVIPYLVTHDENPTIGWYGIDRTFYWSEYALCDVKV